jgi:hypothetical protein
MPVESEQKQKLRNAFLVFLALLWVIGIGVGLRATLNYENRPTASGSAPSIWPAGSKTRRVAGLPTILIFAHPHCPCTRATIGELALAMAKLQGRVTATVFFVRPNGMSEKWESTGLWHDAEQIPGVAVMEDPGGKEAEMFGALASGQTMLYGADGRLLFSGGITSSRGHSGDNAGRSAIVELVSTGKSHLSETPVFGCYLRNVETREGKAEDTNESRSSR